MAEAYTVSKMLSSSSEVMAPVATDPSVSVSLKRKMDNGVMLDTSEKEIAFLDMKARVKHSAQKVAKLDREEKAKWIEEQRLKGNELFRDREYAKAADSYIQALTALDFGNTPEEKAACQRNLQLPLTCNLAACMLMMEQWEKARQMCTEALKVDPKYMKALQQRGRAHAKMNMFDDARNDVREAIAAVSHSTDTLLEHKDILARLEKQLIGIERAERKHKQQLLEQKRFQKKMMQDAVGRLYRDKKEVATSSSSASADEDGPLCSRWSFRGLHALLVHLVAVIGAFFTTLFQKQHAKLKEL